jgi:DNA-binding response OmpR family regulator
MKTKNRILYVEDDLYLAFVTKDNLEIKGYEIASCNNGEKALEIFENENFDLCILDVMLPKMDGFALATAIRKNDKNIPILFLSAKTMKEDRLKGLRLGADDYIVKPFSIEELILKIEIFLKRSKVKHEKQEDEILCIGTYHYNNLNLMLCYADEKRQLTKREAELLKFLIKNKGTVLERDIILQNVWKDDSYFNGRSLDVFISRLRKYLKNDPSLKIKNIHRVGFIFDIEGE